MILYHGTVSALVPSILKQGLKPQVGKRWNIALKLASGHTTYPARYDAHRVAAVYLTDDLELATNYAHNRVVYYRTPVGAVFSWELLSIQQAMLGKDHADAVKLHGAPVILDTTPVVIKVSLTKAYEAVLQEDEGQSGGNAVLCPCVIPPSCLTVTNV